MWEGRDSGLCSPSGDPSPQCLAPDLTHDTGPITICRMSPWWHFILNLSGLNVKKKKNAATDDDLFCWPVPAVENTDTLG